MNKKQAKRISEDLHRQGGPAEQALRIRCERERKARLDVIIEGGDPRKWQNWRQRQKFSTTAILSLKSRFLRSLKTFGDSMKLK